MFELIKRWFDFKVRMNWLKTIDKEVDKRKKLFEKLKRQDFIVNRLLEEYAKRYPNAISFQEENDNGL